MSVSNNFSREYDLRKFSYSGPLLKYFDPFSDWLEKSGFSLDRKQKHLTTVAHFNYFIARKRKHKQSEQPFTTELCKGFIRHLSNCRCKWWAQNQTRNIQNTKSSIKRFSDYLSDHHQITVRKELSPFDEILQNYRMWMSEKRALAAATIKLYSNYIKKFLSWLKPVLGDRGFKLINVCDIERYLLKDFDELISKGKRPMQTALRSFLTFCYETKLTKHSLCGAVPTVKKYQLSHIPKAIKEQDAITLIQSIDQSTSTGKRLHAMCLLMLEYGVRGGQVRKLQHGSINWRDSEIHFSAYKGGKSSTLPLTKEVGNALLNYLQHARPTSNYDEIFLTHRAPYAPLSGNALTASISSAMNKVSVESPRMGSHCFRHAFVARMLKQGESFKYIADLIGHRHIQTTFIYTKIDFAALSDVALDIPEE